jgi:hypothetical protein
MFVKPNDTRGRLKLNSHFPQVSRLLLAPPNYHTGGAPTPRVLVVNPHPVNRLCTHHKQLYGLSLLTNESPFPQLQLLFST